MSKTKKLPTIRMLKVKKGDSLKTIHSKDDKAFTAADLQKFTEIEEGLPARQLLADLEARDREEKQKKKRKPKNGRAQ